MVNSCHLSQRDPFSPLPHGSSTTSSPSRRLRLWIVDPSAAPLDKVYLVLEAGIVCGAFRAEDEWLSGIFQEG